MRLLPVPSTCHSNACFILNPNADREAHDLPIPVEHFPCVLRDFKLAIRTHIHRALRRLKLSDLAELHDRASGGSARPHLGSVKEALVRDEHLVQDLVQEIAIALWKAVEQGKLRAARPVVYRWLQTCARFIVKQHARQAALHFLAASPGNDETEHGLEAPARNTPDHGISSDVGGSRAIHAEILTLLTDSERDALVLSLSGKSGVEIAKILGISPVATRIRLMRARARIAEALACRSPNAA